MAGENILGGIGQGLESFLTNQSLSGIQQRDRKIKQEKQSDFLSLQRERQQALFTDAREVNTRLKAGDANGALGILGERLDVLSTIPGSDPSDTMEIFDHIAAGRNQEATQLLDLTDQIGVQQGFLTDPIDRQIKEAQLAREKSRTASPLFAPSDAEKKEKRLIGLNKQLEIANQSGDQKAISAAESSIKVFEKLIGLNELTPQAKADIDVDKANRIELAKAASKASSEAFTGLKNVRSTILNIGDAITALNKGADTGPIISKLPSFREASVTLDNIRNRMGLDVVGSTTFGALSESELAFALNTALPDDLRPEPLKAWLQRKKKAQVKLAKGLRDAASFLGKPGNTIADYIEKQELKASTGDTDSGLTPAEAEELKQLEQQFGGQ